MICQSVPDGPSLVTRSGKGQPRGGPRLYRFHWREGRGAARIIRWRQERLRPAEAKALAPAIAALAIGAALRVAIVAEDGSTRRCVTTDLAGLQAWLPGRELPPAAASDWTAGTARRKRRVSTFTTMRELLWRAETDGLLELGQAASFAHAFSLALDGSGPFAPGLDE